MTTLTDRDRVVAHLAELAITRPVLYDSFVRLGALQARTPSPCPGCGAHSAVPCEPDCRTDFDRRGVAEAQGPICEECGRVDHAVTCSIGGVMAVYQQDGR